jgi:hypothetical protein
VLVETVKPSADGRGLIIGLFGATGKDSSVKLSWNGKKPVATWITDLTEKKLRPTEKQIQVPAHGVVFVRADLEL